MMSANNNSSALLEILSINNCQFATYLIVTSLLILKMTGVILLTIFYRMKNKVFISEEDVNLRQGGTVASNPDVERVRRAYQNDLENIPMFILIGFAYLFVGAPDWAVLFLFYVFLAARVMHSFVYAVYVIRQPARAISFAVGFLVCIYMCIHVLIYGFFEGYLGK